MAAAGDGALAWVVGYGGDGDVGGLAEDGFDHIGEVEEVVPDNSVGGGPAAVGVAAVGGEWGGEGAVGAIDDYPHGLGVVDGYKLREPKGFPLVVAFEVKGFLVGDGSGRVVVAVVDLYGEVGFFGVVEHDASDCLVGGEVGCFDFEAEIFAVGVGFVAVGAIGDGVVGDGEEVCGEVDVAVGPKLAWLSAVAVAPMVEAIGGVGCGGEGDEVGEVGVGAGAAYGAVACVGGCGGDERGVGVVAGGGADAEDGHVVDVEG